MSRTIIKTDTPGWYEDPATGKKTRKSEGDQILTRAEFQALTAKPTSQRPVNGKPDGEVKALTSGKVGVGPTVVIRCAWVDEDKRTPAQQKLFEQGTKAITYDAVAKAAGGKLEAMPDGRERVIKKQDAFQVRFHPDNQGKWRNELRRRKLRARKAAA